MKHAIADLAVRQAYFNSGSCSSFSLAKPFHMFDYLQLHILRYFSSAHDDHSPTSQQFHTPFSVTAMAGPYPNNDTQTLLLRLYHENNNSPP